MPDVACGIHALDRLIHDECPYCLRARVAARDKEIERLRDLLNCRAGKLLRKGKTFVVVAVDEPYFAFVFDLIRKHEKHHGRWTDDDQSWYDEAIRESFEITDKPCDKCEIDRLRALLREAVDLLDQGVRLTDYRWVEFLAAARAAGGDRES